MAILKFKDAGVCFSLVVKMAMPDRRRGREKSYL